MDHAVTEPEIRQPKKRSTSATFEHVVDAQIRRRSKIRDVRSWVDTGGKVSAAKPHDIVTTYVTTPHFST